MLRGCVTGSVWRFFWSVNWSPVFYPLFVGQSVPNYPHRSGSRCAATFSYSCSHTPNRIFALDTFLDSHEYTECPFSSGWQPILRLLIRNEKLACFDLAVIIDWYKNRINWMAASLFLSALSISLNMIHNIIQVCNVFTLSLNEMPIQGYHHRRHFY